MGHMKCITKKMVRSLIRYGVRVPRLFARNEINRAFYSLFDRVFKYQAAWMCNASAPGQSRAVATMLGGTVKSDIACAIQI